MEAFASGSFRGSANKVLDRDGRRAARRLGPASATATRPGLPIIIADWVIAECVRVPPLHLKMDYHRSGWSSTPALPIQL